MASFKLFGAGRENDLAFSLIGANCRAPDLLLGDLRAMAGAALIATRRIEEFLDDYGMTDLDNLAQTILTRSEQLMRNRIAALPDGCYRHELEIDGYLERVWLRTQVTVRGDEIEMNFAGTSNQTATTAIYTSYNTTSTYGT